MHYSRLTVNNDLFLYSSLFFIFYSIVHLHCCLRNSTQKDDFAEVHIYKKKYRPKNNFIKSFK